MIDRSRESKVMVVGRWVVDNVLLDHMGESASRILGKAGSGDVTKVVPVTVHTLYLFKSSVS